MRYNSPSKQKFTLFGWTMGWIEWAILIALVAGGVSTLKWPGTKPDIDAQTITALRIQNVLANQCTLMYSLSNLKNVDGMFMPGDVTEVIARACLDKARLQHPLPELPGTPE